MISPGKLDSDATIPEINRCLGAPTYLPPSSCQIQMQFRRNFNRHLMLIDYFIIVLLSHDLLEIKIFPKCDGGINIHSLGGFSLHYIDRKRIGKSSRLPVISTTQTSTTTILLTHFSIIYQSQFCTTQTCTTAILLTQFNIFSIVKCVHVKVRQHRR